MFMRWLLRFVIIISIMEFACCHSTWVIILLGSFDWEFVLMITIRINIFILIWIRSDSVRLFKLVRSWVLNIFWKFLINRVKIICNFTISWFILILFISFFPIIIFLFLILQYIGVWILLSQSNLSLYTRFSIMFEMPIIAIDFRYFWNGKFIWFVSPYSTLFKFYQILFKLFYIKFLFLIFFSLILFFYECFRFISFI